MKLYQSVGPNPRVVLMFIEEKGISIDRALVNLLGGENRQGAYLAKNPHGGVPVLELDDGSFLPESTAICEYLEELHPEPRLIGATLEERARTRATVRRIDQTIVVPASNGFRSSEGLALFKERTLCVPEAAAGNKAYAANGLAQVDRTLASQHYVAGERFTLADIVLFAFVEFMGQIGQTVEPALANLARWREEIAARPSATASADPKLGLKEAA